MVSSSSTNKIFGASSILFLSAATLYVVEESQMRNPRCNIPCRRTEYVAPGVYHANPLAQLIEKRGRNLRRGSGDHDRVERRHRRQALAAIADDHVHIVVSQPGESGFRVAGKRRVSLYGINMGTQFREQCGLIAGA